MTREEFKQFTRALFVQFPGLNQWHQEKSPDPAATRESWYRSLSDVSLVEAMGVLADWETGKRQPPQAYERELIAIVIRQSVYLDRDRERAKNNKQDNQQYWDVESRRRSYRPTALGIPSVRAAYEAGRKLRNDFSDGKLTEEEYLQQLNELVERS